MYGNYMYKVLAHTADVALEVQSGDLETLFIDAAKGWKDVVLEDSETSFLQTRTVNLTSFEPEDLLVLWLSELNYFLTVHQWVVHDVKHLKLKVSADEWRLEAEINGEALNSAKHYIYCDVKAVTYHQLNIQEVNGQYQTRIVFDL
jgi:SHS2 domain-containing protein